MTPRQTAWILFGLAGVQLALQLSLLTKGVAYVTGSLTTDDTYYYLQTAWNTKHLGFVTFDGIHSTNGVQLLWFAVVLLLTLVANTKAALLLNTLAVSFLLNGLCLFVIWRIWTSVQRPGMALVTGSLWVLQYLPFRIYSTGMENSLHAMIFWCAVWQSLTFLMRVDEQERPNFWGLTVTLILNAWTRLDSALLSVVLYAFCMLRLGWTYRHDIGAAWRRHGRALAGSGLLAGLAFAAQLGFFRLMGGSFLPVSAIVKTSSAATGAGTTWAERLRQVFILGLPSVLQGRFPDLVLVALATGGILLGLWAWTARPQRRDHVQALFSLWACLLVGELLYCLYIATSGVEYRPYFMWYRSPSFIFWIITAVLMALTVLESDKLSRLSLRFPHWAPAGAGLLISAVAMYLFGRSVGFVSGLYAARYDAAVWVGANFPPNTIFAAWNAGQLGYFSDRTFINLDGLINNIDYYDRVLSGAVPLAEYLSENEVEYVVDYATYAAIPKLAVVQTFPILDGTGRTIHVWQIAPQQPAEP